MENPGGNNVFAGVQAPETIPTGLDHPITTSATPHVVGVLGSAGAPLGNAIRASTIGGIE